jgi:putative peptidoglycan binding protein/transglycosylase-like protein with SLT domain
MRRRAALVAVPAAILLAAGPAHAVTNPQVPGLQVALREKGFYRGSIDGIAGPMTAHAVRAFQRRAGITVDGIAGPQTRRALGRLGRPLWGKRKLIAPGMVGWDVSALEFFLARRDLRPGAVDGRFNHRTAAAVRRLQHRKHLAADGVVGPQTLKALGVRQRSPRAGRAAPPSMLAVQGSLRRWSRYYGVSLQLVRALAWMESGFQPTVRSSAGAWGVMQVTPGTWRYVENFIIAHRVPHSLDGGVRVGVAYFHQLLHEFDFRRRRALAAYYQGPWAVRKYGLYRETRRFVANVLALRSRFSSV